jgi:4-hydroxy-tetrahydrodipicolinate synthase
MMKMVKAALEGKTEEAKKLHYELMPFFKAEFIDTNPIPIKYMMSEAGRCREVYRLPMFPMDDKKKETAKSVLKALGII